LYTYTTYIAMKYFITKFKYCIFNYSAVMMMQKYKTPKDRFYIILAQVIL